MKRVSCCLFLLITIISGCAVKIVPESVPNGIVNQKDNSLTLAHGNIVITVAPADPEMINYNLEGMVASFVVEVQNNGDSEVAFANDSFLLLDNEKHQHYQLTPEKVRQMLAKDSYYLLPYPYVGFYYLEDYEQASFRNATDSNLPYYFELRPQDIYTKALPTDPLIPKAKMSGLIYFHADISTMKSFSILAYQKDRSKSATPDFTFPFKVEK